jgi:adenosylcobinamide-phosphate synthase
VNPARSRHCHRGTPIREPGNSGRPQSFDTGAWSPRGGACACRRDDRPFSRDHSILKRRPGRSLGLLLGTAADAVFGDPSRGHPVAAFGNAVSAAEQRLWSDRRSRGAAFVLLTAGPVVAASAAAQARSERTDLVTVLTAAATWTVLGGASLAGESLRIAELLEAGDLAAARLRLPALCGRDPRNLDAAQIARAVVESVAENTCDAVVAPLVWGAACGLPGLLGHRAVNTLDAMIGHHSSRYERFGWAAARLDDLAAFVPARLTALLAVALAPAVGGSASRGWRVLRRDGGQHPSPNAGRCEAAFAGVLGVRLGGVNVYGGRVERRGPLGDGPPPGPRDIRRAVTLLRLITAATALGAAAPVALSNGCPK